MKKIVLFLLFPLLFIITSCGTQKIETEIGYLDCFTEKVDYVQYHATNITFYFYENGIMHSDNIGKNGSVYSVDSQWEIKTNDVWGTYVDISGTNYFWYDDGKLVNGNGVYMIFDKIVYK